MGFNHKDVAKNLILWMMNVDAQPIIRPTHAVYLVMYYVDSKTDIKTNQGLVSAVVTSYGFCLNSKVLF